MNTRELIILLLGFVIVGIVLRGLYAAFKARRGQIRLAIDKNIPQNIDLEALELAELPGGGARVVDRSEELAAGLSAVTAANLKAEEFDLGEAEDDADDIPVLMDAVELSEAKPVSFQESIDFDDELLEPEQDAYAVADEDDQINALPEIGDDTFPDEIEHSLGENFDGESFEAQELAETDSGDQPAAEEDADQSFDETVDDVLFDYDESDGHGAAEQTLGDTTDDFEEDIDDEDDAYGQSRQHVAVDGLASVMPDYPDQQAAIADPMDAPAESADTDFHSAIDEAYETETEAEYSEDTELEPEHAEGAYEDTSEDRLEHDYAEHPEEDDAEEDWQDADSQQDEYAAEEEREQPQLGSTASFEAGLDEFSMSAGERIGYGDKASEEAQAAEPVEAAVQPKRRSLFGLFKRKPKADASQAADEDDFLEDDFPEDDFSENAELPEFQSPTLREPTEQLAQQSDLIPDTEFEQEFEQETEQDFEDEPEFDSYAADSSTELPVDVDEPSAAHYGGNDESATEPTAAVADNESGSPAESHPSQPTEVIVLNVMAKDGYSFAGHDLLEVLVTSGLKFGEMNIFHQRLNNEPKGPVLFSVANVLNPGSFDLNNMDEFTTLGVSLFLAMPSPINNLQAFNQMLNVAEQIRDYLNGELKDDNRIVMTAQTVEHYRQRIRDFELRCLKAAGGRG